MIQAERNWNRERIREAVVKIDCDPEAGKPIAVPIRVYQNPNPDVLSLIRPDTQDRTKAYFGEDGSARFEVRRR